MTSALVRRNTATARRSRRALLHLATFLLLCPLFGGASSATPASGGSRETTAARDETFIRAALVQHVARYNARDWRAMLGEYTEDVLVMPSYVATAEGRDGVSALYRGEFASAEATESKSVMEARLDEVQVHGDWAFDRGTITIMTSQGGYERKLLIRFMDILRRQPDGGWKITRSMDNPITRPFGSASDR